MGDVILFRLDENRFNLVGREPTISWVQFHCETGATTSIRPRRPFLSRPDQLAKQRHYRYEIQAPAPRRREKLNGSPLPTSSSSTSADEGGQPRVPASGTAWRAAGRGDLGPYEGAEVKRRSSGGENSASARSAPGLYHQHPQSGWTAASRRVRERMKSYREWLPAGRYKTVNSSPAASSPTTSRTTSRARAAATSSSTTTIGREALGALIRAAVEEGHLRVDPGDVVRV